MACARQLISWPAHRFRATGPHVGAFLLLIVWSTNNLTIEKWARLVIRTGPSNVNGKELSAHLNMSSIRPRIAESLGSFRPGLQCSARHTISLELRISIRGRSQLSTSKFVINFLL